MEQEVSIKVDSVGKVYNLYEKSSDRLKEALFFSKRKYHKEYNALKNVSFSVYKGETFGVIGKNGAGKSTLLKLITGVAQPTQGHVEINGKVSALLELGAGFNQEYTGLQNIYLNGSMMGYSKEEMEPRVKQVIEFADIGDFINQPVKNYSSGMFARLAFAVAINVEPDILIVDEALSVGDVFFQNKCYKKFEELRSKGTTILFVSHDIASVKQMCSRALWLEQGTQKMLGDCVEVCNAYTNSILQKGGTANTNDYLDTSDEREYVVGEFELENYPPVAFTNESILNPDVRILSVYCQDNDGVMVQDLDIGKKYKVVVIFETDIEIEECIVGFVLETVKGNWLINCNSAICGKKSTFHVQKDSKIKIEFEIIMPNFINGEYVVGAAVSDGQMRDFKVLTWLYNTMYVRINNRGNNAALLDIDSNINIYKMKGK